MPCYHPLKGFKRRGGGITWSPLEGFPDLPMEVPCGQCIGCRLERSREWAVRILHEAQLHDSNVFLTLTYADEHLPYRGTLVKRDFQLFMKRLRRFFSAQRLSFYMCGEYGETNPITQVVDGGLYRPHFHAIVFNCDFADRVLDSHNGRGDALYRSAILDRLWSFGRAVIGDVTFESAAYCARYCCKKVTGRGSADHYRRVDVDTGEIYYLEPEYAHMSLKTCDGKGGIGYGWYEKFGQEIDDHDSVVMRGVEMSVPRYYDKLRSKLRMKLVKSKRLRDAYKRPEELSEARRLVKEKVKLAQCNFLGRKLI